MMRYVFFAAAAAVLSFSPAAAAVKSCADLQAEIAAKLAAKGVKDYQLNIAAKHEQESGKVVGTCEEGSKKIVYSKLKRSEAASQPTAAEDEEARQEQVPVVAVRMVPAEEEQRSRAVSAHIKPCTDLKTEIAARLDSKGVKNYTLIILNKSEGALGQVVGVCENGSKKIIYAKTR